jgi:ABC-type multidrug transport system fused ATPase/permease subunit
VQCVIVLTTSFSVRNAIDIIPQEALLFAGTFRENIDVRGEHNDDKIWDALGKMQVIQ